MRFANASDKSHIEAIVNNPLLRTWTACDGCGPCDATKYIKEPSFTLIGNVGCFLALCIDPGRYVIHTNLMPHCRGEEAMRVAQEALHMAFVKTDAIELLTMVPGNMPHAKLMARRNGFRHLFDRPKLWHVSGERFDVGFYRLTLEEWIMTGIHSEAGRKYHNRLHHELGANDHPDDPVHDSFVGAAIEMVLSGNVTKGIDTYNRWARFALYQPVRVISTDPLRIDIKQCVLRVDGDQFFMEKHHA